MGNVKRNGENLFLLLNLYVVPKYSTSTGQSKCVGKMAIKTESAQIYSMLALRQQL